MKIIVVGAVAGGPTVASQIHRTIPEAEIIVIGRDAEVGYGTCGMPYVISGVIEEKRKVKGVNPEKFGAERDINMLTLHEVTAINREAKTVDIQNVKTNETFTQAYDKLILSTGGQSRIPDIKGLGNLPLLNLRTYADMEKILTYLDEEKPKSCAIIGGGFIGVELAESFIKRGIKTRLIERNERVMKVMDPEITAVIDEEMRKHGVEFYFNDAIERVEGKRLIMNNGIDFEVDFIAASVGVVKNVDIAEEIGLTVGPTKGLVVNDYMQTNDPDIYAIGDIAECKDWFTGKPKNVQLAWHAHRQSFIVASHLSGKPVKLNGLLGATITKIFTITAAMTGHSAKSLTDEGIDFDTVIHKGRTNAGYYPEHGMITLLVHYDKNTRLILGGQAVGDMGVDKRIDVITTAIMGKMTVDDLAALELSYSPPFSSPKDPVNMLGYKAK